MEHPKAGFAEQVRSLPRTFYVANTMEIFGAWRGMACSRRWHST